MRVFFSRACVFFGALFIISAFFADARTSIHQIYVAQHYMIGVMLFILAKMIAGNSK